MKTNVWLTVLTIALVFNAVMMQNKVDGDECTSGIRKEHLDPTPGHFVDGQTIQIGSNGLCTAPTNSTSVKYPNVTTVLPDEFQEMPGMCVTLNTTGTKLFIMFDATTNLSANNGYAHYFIYVDGIFVKRAVIQKYTGIETLSVSTLVTGLTPGSHEVKVRWAGYCTSTYADTPAELAVIDLP